MKWPIPKLFFLVLMIVVYIGLAVSFKVMTDEGIIEPDPPLKSYEEEKVDFIDIRPNLIAAQEYVNSDLMKDDGHILLYRPLGTYAQKEYNQTNSEAVSYYLLWNAQKGDKEMFDAELDFMQEHMLHERGYMMWRLEPDQTVTIEGSNIATDADLRTIKALLIAEQRWGDRRYTQLIGTISEALEEIGVTSDGYLAPYGGVAGDGVWSADEVWLSYADFVVFEALSQRRGEPWTTMHQKMKDAVLKGQVEKGLYNSQLTLNRKYANDLDDGDHGINSLWIMVRNAESYDPQLRESAYRALKFYKNQYKIDAELYPAYTTNGYAVSPTDAPWVYALVGRAAAALGDQAFANMMLRELIASQRMDGSHKGAIPEGYGDDLRVGQFTMQESILTMQEYEKAFT